MKLSSSDDGQARRVGYVERERAANLTLILDPIGVDAFFVSASEPMDRTAQIRLALPKLAPLRVFVCELEQSPGARGLVISENPR